MAKKPTHKKLTQTKLLRKYEPELRDIVIRRDGGRCQVAGFRHKCGEQLVADHRPASRKHHATFLDPRNLTTVCNSANFLAEMDPFVSDKIIEVVRKREGEEAFKELEALSRTPRRWDELEIRKWIDDCKRYFLRNKSGKPK